MRAAASLLVLALLSAACSGDAPLDTAATSAVAPSTPTTSTTQAATEATTAAPTTATTTAPAVAPDEPLDSYRFRMTLGLAGADLDEASIQQITALIGERASSPEAAQVFGQLGGEDIRFVSDGARWWDVGDTGEELSFPDVEFFLAANGFLLPSVIAPLLIDETAWTSVGTAEVAGIETELLHRSDIIKDVDWGYGDLTRLDIWRSDAGEILKFIAWFATGDNTGFPVAIYEVVAANPEITIELPES